MSFLSRLFSRKNPSAASPAIAESVPESVRVKAIVSEETDRINALNPDDTSAWTDYWQHFSALPYEVRALVGYEQARLGNSSGTSGFHGLYRSPCLPLPFSFLGWADYDQPGWGPTQGVAFRIERGCFSSDAAQLYYFDDDQFPSDHSVLSIIEACSSGLTDIRTEHRVCPDQWNHVAERKILRFTLDPNKIRETVILSGRAARTADVGGYVFVLPRCGEFYCQLGEIRDDEMIPLHTDDFCMK